MTGFNRMKSATPVTVRVRLHRGDARTVVAPAAVIGDRSPLRRWLEQQHGAVFEPVITRQRFAPSPTPALTWQATLASGPRDAISFFGPKPVLDEGKVTFDWSEDS